MTATIRPLRGSRASSESVPSPGSPRSEQSTSVSPDSSWTQAVSARRASAVAMTSPEPGTQRIRRNQLAPSALAGRPTTRSAPAERSRR